MGYASVCPHSTVPKRTPSWFAATSLNPLCRVRMFPLGSPNEAHLPRYMDDKRLRGEFEDTTCVLHSCLRRGCSRLLKCNAVTAVSTRTRLHPDLLTNILSKIILTSHIHRPREHTVGCRPVYACTRGFSKECRIQPRASTLYVESVCFHSVSRMRHSRPLPCYWQGGGARARHRTSLYMDDKRLYEGSSKIRHAHFTRVCAGDAAVSRSVML